ncbi:MAG: insulinase family protein, partial [Phycisphaerales bacterium]
MTTLMRFTVRALALGLLIGPATPLHARPLPSDPRIITGKLDNGVTWQYRRHDNPPGKMWVLIHVRTGSLNETDAQQGLAHFMEHMAFNGTENFPPGELIPYFESIGMEFGPDLNASTFFDQTMFMLFLPDAEIPQVEKALTVLSDYAFRNLLLIEEIDAERGVILEELRSRKSPYQRIRDRLWPELYEGSHFANRLPIGKEEVIANAPREQFEDYYRTWYRPENVTVVMVGDAPHEAYIPLIDKWFGQYRPDRPARPQKGPEFKPFTKQRAIVVTDPELSDCDVEMYNIRPGRPPTTTAEQWRTQLVEYIANWIMGRRFDVLITRGQAAYLQASTYVTDFFQDALLSHGWASGEAADWNKMLEQLVLEVSRAREHGFTEYELNLAGKEILADAEHAVKTEPTLDARSIAMGMIAAVNDEEPVLSAEQELALTREFLPTVTLAEVNASFRKHFEPGTFAYVVKTPDQESVSVPSKDVVLAAARAAWARKTEPFQVEEAPTGLLARLPEPGSVVEEAYDEDLEITDAWLSNGVRLHHRFMDYKKD